LSLPGIGEYTAAAISSIAFNEQKAVVDGNVFRVLARLFGIGLNINTPAGKKHFFELANSIIPERDPGLFNQAMMEFGALFCIPKNPSCDECFFRHQCVAFRSESQHLYPVKTKPVKRKRRYFNYLVIKTNKKCWMRERKEKDIWKGLHEFYLLESNRQLKDEEAIRLLKKELSITHHISDRSVRLKQILSHQEIIARFFELKVMDEAVSINGGKFYSQRDMNRIAKPVLITKYLESSNFELR
jgi:A/G-specific adenine glycosylase